MPRGYDPDKHVNQIEAQRAALSEAIRKADEKIIKAGEIADRKRAAVEKSDAALADLRAERDVLAGRLRQADAVLATIRSATESAVESEPSDDAPAA